MNKHGGYYGDNQGEVIDFSVNINPLGVSTKVKDKIKEVLDNIEKYPEIDGKSGRKLISEDIGLEEDEVILGNGAIELIYLFASGIKPQKTMIIQPAFNEYERALRATGSEIINFYNNPENDFKINIYDLINQIRNNKPDLLMLCNPNNPTGSFININEFQPVLEELKEIGAYLFLDESFIDFTREESYSGLIKEYPIFIIRSMTKFFAIPGLRLGYGIGNKNIIEKLNRHKTPWAINSLALSIVPILLNDKEYINKTNEWYREEKEFLKQGLNQLDNIRVFPSLTNFFLLKIEDEMDLDLKKELLHRNIYIRDCLDFYGLDDTYFRIAVKENKDNQRLVKELKDILG